MCYLGAVLRRKIPRVQEPSTFNNKRLFGTDLEQLYVYIISEIISEQIQRNYTKICTLYKKLYDPENCSFWC